MTRSVLKTPECIVERRSETGNSAKEKPPTKETDIKMISSSKSKTNFSEVFQVRREMPQPAITAKSQSSLFPRREALMMAKMIRTNTMTSDRKNSMQIFELFSQRPTKKMRRRLKVESEEILKEEEEGEGVNGTILAKAHHIYRYKFEIRYILRRIFHKIVPSGGTASSSPSK